jgi:hypothetical protein
MRQLTLAAALATLLAGCATARVEAAYSPKTDFAAYRTYAWLPEAADPGQAGAEGRQQALALVQQAVDRELGARGLRRVEDGSADLRVAARVQGKPLPDTSSPGSYKGGAGAYAGPLTSNTASNSPDLQKAREGTLTLDLLDARTNELVWRGSFSDTVADPGHLRLFVDDAVKRLLDGYPPGKK